MVIISPGASLLTSASTGAPAARARSDGVKLATKGTAVAAAATAPTPEVAIRSRRRSFRVSDMMCSLVGHGSVETTEKRGGASTLRRDRISRGSGRKRDTASLIVPKTPPPERDSANSVPQIATHQSERIRPLALYLWAAESVRLPLWHCQLPDIGNTGKKTCQAGAPQRRQTRRR